MVDIMKNSLRPHSTRRRHHYPKLVLIALLAGLFGIGVASAHIGVNPAQVRPATLETFVVRVPSEKEVPTIAVRIEFPAGLIVSRFQTIAGWQREVEKDAAGRVTAVEWSGGEIVADEFADFVFLARTPREPGVLVFPAYQTYQGGETVAWTGGELDNFPAPMVEVTGESASEGTSGGVGSIEEQSTSTAVASTAAPAEATSAPTQPAAQTAAATVAVTIVPTDEPADVAVTATLPSAGGEPLPESQVPQQTTSNAVADPNAGGSDLPLFVAMASLVVASTLR